MINIYFYKLYIYELKLYIFYIPDKDNFIIYIQHKIYNLKIKINIYSLNKYIYINN